ncbi:MAG: sulfate ABC transporter substrate-binding protein [Microcoleus sp. PH2017_10_PVI_O_A]|uniref:sulfate ABC transporter substrate-binding protein n=1 Tax=unclassified Microcoleus TaxID=2642155 RepID=UPI001DF72D36|nr:MULTISPECIES: sulfate ABC transporter substrate-binding protein [unclassified Microcoleus]TAE80380.1 MAG: sulfate ABC transporter substrate-binding protein [Oscillatoriales cyanobacterium]MCC3407076.1 sulfate ABC transporter substrate-binding protein [Microcoleus sp. PH2017_10_PVI_O_A]MCC3461822.1 sulfate ABC transporter substrate-binding protein [Microcoleus sp. PH2017_11_PCY_U_A]MCC3477977.1 sulfate ABC transporter substrate-binding protein [Microcoleus sp. PH2017_12_PCY_D_A]MCC3529085.1 
MQYHHLKDNVLQSLKKKAGFSVSSLKSIEFRKSSIVRVFAFFFAVGLGFSWLIPQTAIGQPKPKDVELTLVSFAVTKSAYDRIVPGFVAKWKRENNQNVTISQSYGGSGSQTRAVISGLEADVVHLALEFDTDRIQQAGLIKPGWQREVPNNGIVSKSVAALVTRPGNPKKIQGWADLAKPGIKVITANPKTSGVARWNFLALWGSVTRNGGSEQQASTFVSQVYKNVPVLPRDAREASDTFYKQNQGDVLINYENEILLARTQGETEPFIIPQVNISIDNPVAVVDKYAAKHGTTKVAEAFVKYLYTPEAQREFAKVGFRPVNSTVAGEFSSKFPRISKLFTIADVGGWNAVQNKFFADNAMFDQIQNSLGRR